MFKVPLYLMRGNEMNLRLNLPQNHSVDNDDDVIYLLRHSIVNRDVITIILGTLMLPSSLNSH